MFGRLRDKKRAFTLPEVIITLSLLAVILGALLTSLAAVARRLEYLADYRKAAARVAGVEAFLRAPAAYCGYGMPLEPGRYAAVFADNSRAPFNWPGPVSAAAMKRFCAGPKGCRRDNALLIAFAMPGRALVKELTILDASNDILTLNHAAGSPGFSDILRLRPDLRLYVCFGSAIPPGSLMKVEKIISGTALKMRWPGFSRVTVQKNDRIGLFRVLEIWTTHEILYSNDYSGSGRQPRLRGICDLRFKVDLDAKKLTAYVMARGDKKYKKAPAVRGIEDWPREYLADAYVNESNYLLLVSKIVWELPNCRRQTFLNSEDVTEAF